MFDFSTLNDLCRFLSDECKTSRILLHLWWEDTTPSLLSSRSIIKRKHWLNKRSQHHRHVTLDPRAESAGELYQRQVEKSKRPSWKTNCAYKNISASTDTQGRHTLHFGCLACSKVSSSHQLLISCHPINIMYWRTVGLLQSIRHCAYIIHNFSQWDTCEQENRPLQNHKNTLTFTLTWSSIK